jgi:hypothetical protein
MLVERIGMGSDFDPVVALRLSLQMHHHRAELPKLLRRADWLTPLSPCERVPIGVNRQRFVCSA